MWRLKKEHLCRVPLLSLQLFVSVMDSEVGHYPSYPQNYRLLRLPLQSFFLFKLSVFKVCCQSTVQIKDETSQEYGSHTSPQRHSKHTQSKLHISTRRTPSTAVDIFHHTGFTPCDCKVWSACGWPASAKVVLWIKGRNTRWRWGSHLMMCPN